MPGIALIASAVSSLKSAYELTKAMVGIRDAKIINSRVIELQGVILSAQSDAMAAHSDQFMMLERIRELEQIVADLKAWDTEKQRYRLEAVTPTVFAYTLKPDAAGSEPPHWLCTACYQNGKKSILSTTMTTGHKHLWKCPGCSAQNLIDDHVVPEWTVPVVQPPP
jgi:hypothetical protein